MKVADGPEQVTVAEIDGLLYLPGHPREQLQRALRIPSLSAGWRGSLQALVADEGKEKQGNAGLAPSVAPACVAGLSAAPRCGGSSGVCGVRSFVLRVRRSIPFAAAPSWPIFGLQARPESARLCAVIQCPVRRAQALIA